MNAEQDNNYGDYEFMAQLSRIKPKPKRNYFNVLQNLKSNNGKQYGRRCVGTITPHTKIVNHSGDIRTVDYNKMGQYWIKPESNINNYISLNHSCYATINTFHKGGSPMKNKKTGQVYYYYHHTDNLVDSLCGLFIDMDAHLIGKHWGADLYFVYPKILNKSKLPKPSFVINSSHGLHSLWLFNKEVVVNNKNVLGMWQKVEDKFVDKMSKASKAVIGKNIVDTTVHDPARYLRIPGSYNCKHGEYNRVITLVDNHVSYSLTGNHKGLYYDYIKRNETRKNKRSKRDEKVPVYHHQKYSYKYHHKSSHYKSNFNYALLKKNLKLGRLAYLLINRLRDYKELIQLRNKSGINGGYRNELLFQYAKDLIQFKHRNHSLLYYVQKVNKLFNYPLLLDEVKQVVRAGSYSDDNSKLTKYHYTNKYIISHSHLNITLDEQKYMVTLISNKERARRIRVSNHRSSVRCHNWRKQHGLIGKVTKTKWKRKKKIFEAIKLLKSNSETVVANKLGVSRRTLLRWLHNKNYKV